MQFLAKVVQIFTKERILGLLFEVNSDANTDTDTNKLEFFWNHFGSVLQSAGKVPLQQRLMWWPGHTLTGILNFIDKS